ncbi:MAG: hypothetical protein K2G23_10335 [Muribaculaceae bacterium]|nr:hypothetical protein [Muribaculaceae bacterium]
MIKAKDVISQIQPPQELKAEVSVPGEMPLVDVLPRLLDAPGRILGVEEDGERVGVIDQTSLLEGLGRMIPVRDDSSLVTVECAPADYSASRLSHAVEDSDAHIVDLWSAPAENGKIRVTLRVRRSDPTPTIHNLERYGYDVVDTSSAVYQDAEVAWERLLALNTLLNV